MLKESLEFLKEKNYNQEIKDIDLFLDNLIKFSDNELYSFLKEGVKISENIVLKFHEYNGFSCYNMDRMQVGNLPICALIEKRLNQFLRNNFSNPNDITL